MFKQCDDKGLKSYYTTVIITHCRKRVVMGLAIWGRRKNILMLDFYNQ